MERNKDELIRRIQSCLDLNYSINENFFKQTLRMMMEYLEQEEANGWIPVEERLPDSDRLVLLSFYNYPIPSIGRYIGDEDNGGAFYTDESDKPLCTIGFIVNAWMELPERYNG